MPRGLAIQIPCPQCGGSRTYVVATYHTEHDELIRRRRCDFCNHRWYTRQQPEQPVSQYRIKWKPGKRIVELTDD